MGDGDTYAQMIGLIRGETAEQGPTGETSSSGLGAGPVKIRLGRVSQRAPLRVTVAGTEQPTEVLRVNERLVKGAMWKTKITSSNSGYRDLSGPLGGPVTCAHAGCAPELSQVASGDIHSGDTTIDEATVEQLEIDLEEGDQVLLLTEDDQIFFILCKVVNAV